MKIEEIETLITNNLINYLEINPSSLIEVGEKDKDFFATKLKIHYLEGEDVNIGSIFNDILRIYEYSGLSNKENGKIIISNLELSPNIYDLKKSYNMRGIIANIKYSYDK